MKKIFITLIICVLISTAVFYCTRSEKVMKFMVKDIDVSDIVFNDMAIKNNTYHYNTLNNTQKQVYRTIANGVMNFDECITIKVTSENNYDEVKKNIEISLAAFFNDHPEVFYIGEAYEISLINTIAIKVINLKLNYISKDKEEIASMEQKLESQIQGISQKLVNVKSEYEKELIIHDLIATNVKYYDFKEYEDIPTIQHTAYGALVDRTAVCDGISKAFQLVLEKNGIESILVTGSYDGVAHAWNKVKIDGDYYNVDVTSDKTLNKENRSNIVHSYFNVTDDEINLTHTIDSNELLPKCTSTRYNFYLYNDYVIAPIDNFEYKLSEIIQKQSASGLVEVCIYGINDIPSMLVQSLYNLNFNNYRVNKITKMAYSKINNNYIVVK